MTRLLHDRRGTTLIRPLTSHDVDDVASLYEIVMRSGSRWPPPELAAGFTRILLDAPWKDDEIPSLVYAEPNGEIVGFLAVHVRRLLLDGQPIRAACSGPFVVHPKARAKGIGLLQRFLKGPQDFAFTDGATQKMRRIWEGVGGVALHLSCVRWSRIFRPFQLASRKLQGGSSNRTAAAFLAAARPLSSVADAVTRLGPRLRARPPEASVQAEELTVSNLLDSLDVVARKRRLRPEYDAVYLEWLFREMRDVRQRGILRGFLVRDRSGNPLGWYLYFLKSRGLSQVVQIAATSSGMDAVLDHLMHDADQGGSLALQGRVEPDLLVPLAARRALFQYSEPLALAHCKNPAIHECLLTGSSLMTRLDGEWWMGFHL